MAKSFFKVYVETKKRIMYLQERYLINKNDLTCTCFDALEHYLNQYTWVRHEDEKVCFDFCEDDISLAEVAQMNEMSYNTLRSMTSRVSARLYKRFGYDFKDVILGDDVEKQEKLKLRCDSKVDEYKLKDNYPKSILPAIELGIGYISVTNVDDFKITRKDLLILKFLADYDRETISKRLELIDTNRLAVICHILSNKRYCDERIEVLRVMNKIKDRETLEYWKNDVDILRGVKTVSDNKE